jgi:hypothetical protein
MKMSKTNQSVLLYNKIAALEDKRKLELVGLQEQYACLIDSARPSNLLKQSFSEVYQNAALNKKAIITTITSFVVGYFSKKLIVGKSKNSGKKLIVDLLQYAIPLLMNKFNNSDIEEEYSSS